MKFSTARLDHSIKYNTTTRRAMRMRVKQGIKQIVKKWDQLIWWEGFTDHLQSYKKENVYVKL